MGGYLLCSSVALIIDKVNVLCASGYLILFQIILAPLKSQAIQSLYVYFIATIYRRTLCLFNRSFSVLVQKINTAWLKRVFVYTGTSMTKNPAQVTPVHSTTRMSSQGQPSAHYTAEIESTASSMTTV